MSVETIHKIILHPFIQESLSSLKAMTGLEGRADEAFIDNVEDFRFKGYAVCSDMKGNLDGVILMHHYSETAVAVGQAVQLSLVGESNDSDTLNEDLVSALEEWGNTIVGRATHLLQKHNLGFEFASPHVALDLEDMTPYLKGVKQIVTVPVHVEGVGRYYFNLLVREVQQDNVYTDVNLTSEAHIIPPPLNGVPVDKNALIMTVDDSPMIRKAIVRLLADMGYTNTIEADDGASAVEMMRSDKPDFVFMDVVMKQVNGDRALEAIRSFDTQTPVVMLSSVTDSTVVDRCQQLGVHGFIFKPLNAENSLELLRSYLKV
ncbi:response regulator [Echinimonas agarilytica]|uniref:Response regulator n=1 Tax=Echinimonas agarilytica TaxID=1215918 RepID=A0AA41W4D8_9GAMM|nr:response regulator [Echinimonas agarilytica]MCM2678531.1 response regulator [Echinimonas agarilytica]